MNQTEQILKQVEDSLRSLFGDAVERIDTESERQMYLRKARHASDPTLKAAYLRLAEGDE
jgi:hypothetical protein